MIRSKRFLDYYAPVQLRCDIARIWLFMGTDSIWLTCHHEPWRSADTIFLKLTIILHSREKKVFPPFLHVCNISDVHFHFAKMQCVKTRQIIILFYCFLKPALEGFFIGLILLITRIFSLRNLTLTMNRFLIFFANDKIRAPYQTNISPNSLNKVLQTTAANFERLLD